MLDKGRCKQLMAVNQNILDFINYKYVPFSKGQCGCRILYLWLVGVALCLLPPHKPSWFFCIFLCTAFVSGIFIYLSVKLADKQTSRFLCNGLYFLYLSVFLTLAAYRINAYACGPNGLKLVLFLLGLLVSMGLFLLLIFKNIKDGKYGAQPQNSSTPIMLAFFAVLGTSLGKIIFSALSEQQGLQMISIVVLLIACLVGIPTHDLLKFILIVWIDKQKSTGDGFA